MMHFGLASILSCRTPVLSGACLPANGQVQRHQATVDAVTAENVVPHDVRWNEFLIRSAAGASDRSPFYIANELVPRYSGVRLLFRQFFASCSHSKLIAIRIFK
jgi:hypothetical protein